MANETATWSVGVEYAALSDIGLRRLNNQDAVRAVIAPNEQQWRARGHLFIVADGMGAHAAGELASKMAVDIIAHEYLKQLDQSPPLALREAFEEANRRIHAHGQDNLEFRGMGTTASALVLLPEGALIAHVGDSRVYRLRENQLEQLTFDHSLVWELMHSGDMRPQEVPEFVPKNIITRSLGPNAQVRVDLEGPFPVRENDAFILCSDGLSGPLSDAEIGILAAYLPPSEAAQALIDWANLHGGPDNISVIVARATRAMNAPVGSASLHLPPPPSNAADTTSRQPTIAIFWGGALLLLLLAGMLGVAGLMVPAAAAAVLALVDAVVALLMMATRGAAGRGASTDVQRFGKAPYRSLVVEPTPDLIQRLAQTVHELREAGLEGQWNLDWDRFDRLEHSAADAVRMQRFDQAVRDYAHAMSFMMDQVRRNAPKKKASDPST